jgi:hypothetical protein
MSNYYSLQNAIISGVLSSSIATGYAVKIIDPATEFIQPITATTDAWMGVLMGSETATNDSASTANVALRGAGNIVKVKLGSTAYKGQGLLATATGTFVSGSNTFSSSVAAVSIVTSDAIACQAGVTNDLVFAKIN